MLDKPEISVRDLSEEDVPHIINYWFYSPKGFIEAMGVDLAKLPTEDEMAMSLYEKIKTNKNSSNSKLNAVVICFQGEPIGFHTIFPLVESDYGIFHAHIWNPAFRGKGIALCSYPKACQVFFERFGLRKILFKTPIQNIGAIRVKEKLGIPCIGQEAINFGIIKNGTVAKVFELTRSNLQAML